MSLRLDKQGDSLSRSKNASMISIAVSTLLTLVMASSSRVIHHSLGDRLPVGRPRQPPPRCGPTEKPNQRTINWAARK